MKYLNIALHGGGNYTLPLDDLGSFIEEIKEAPTNEERTYTLTIVVMSKEKYEALPEFEGH